LEHANDVVVFVSSEELLEDQEILDECDLVGVHGKSSCLLELFVNRGYLSNQEVIQGDWHEVNHQTKHDPDCIGSYYAVETSLFFTFEPWICDISNCTPEHVEVIRLLSTEVWIWVT